VSDTGGTIQYLHHDLVGTTRLITSSTGAVVGTSEYDPYGNRTNHTGTADSAIGYSGNWTDSITGLVYLRARDYDPATAQFLTVDPAVDTTREPYAYVANDPLGDTDLTGRCASPVQLSPHVYDSSDDPNLKWMEKQFRANGGTPQTTETAEMNIWYLVCENGAPCGASFLATLRGMQGSGIINQPGGVSGAVSRGIAVFTLNGAKSEWTEGTMFKFPAGGTVTENTPFNLKGTGWRLDVENPGGGQGNIHIQPENGSFPKYYYNPISKSFTDAEGNPAPVRDMAKLQSSDIWQRQIGKALRYLPQVSATDPTGVDDDPGLPGFGEGAAGGE
jgi:RHS repeat-associated protein